MLGISSLLFDLDDLPSLEYHIDGLRVFAGEYLLSLEVLLGLLSAYLSHGLGIV